MADTKITALAAITTVDPAADVLPIVDISDTSMAASGTTKKITSNQILGAGGTATLASATITGDLTVDTSTLKVDSGNDRVGVGTASPATGTKLDVAGFVRGTSGAVFQGANNITSGAGIEIGYSTGSQYSFLQSFDRTGAAYKAIRLVGSSIDFDIANTVKANLDASGNLNIANGNLVMSTSGKGIDFSATASGSGTMTSELLNDYEEGTFIATLKGNTTDPTTPVTVTARYTKIGRVVNVIIYFGNVNTTGASGSVQVIGLPFTSASGSFFAGSTASGDTATFTGTLGAWIAPASTQVDLLASPSGGSITGATHNAGAGRYLALNITYTV